MQQKAEKTTSPYLPARCTPASYLSGRETLPVEEKVAVAEGKSEIYFTGEGSCEFKLEMTAGAEA